MCHREWGENSVKSVEAITLLELLAAMRRKGRHMTVGKIVVGFDNRLT